MVDLKERLKAEQEELQTKLNKLINFLESENFKKIDDVQKTLLNVQARSMETYNQVLQERIVRLQQTKNINKAVIMNIEDYLNYICGVADSTLKGNKVNAQIIDGIAEVEINGKVYQAQVVLEPNKKDWVNEGEVTIRKIISANNLKDVGTK